MEITTHCPLCKTPMHWLLHDDVDIYTCSSISQKHECPIDFEEEILFADGIEAKSMTEGVLLSLSFVLDNYHIKVESSKQTSSIWREDFPCTDSPTLVVKRIIDPPPGTAGNRKWIPVLKIPYTFKIDWQNLDDFKNRLKTWIVFS